MRYKASIDKDADITKLRADMTDKGAERLFLAEKEDAIFFDASSEGVARQVGEVSGLRLIVRAED